MAKQGEATRIVIKKKKVGHGGHHGGAWKVAYADFVTAMMALFMVLWLLTQADVKLRSQIAQYFRDPGVLPGGSLLSEERNASYTRDPNVVEKDIVLLHRNELRRKHEKRESDAAGEQARLEKQAKAIEDAVRAAVPTPPKCALVSTPWKPARKCPISSSEPSPKYEPVIEKKA